MIFANNFRITEATSYEGLILKNQLNHEILSINENGEVQANSYHADNIFFNKDGIEQWRMFEDEDGLYLENIDTGKIYKFVMQEIKDQNTLNNKIADLEARIAALEALIE